MERLLLFPLPESEVDQTKLYGVFPPLKLVEIAPLVSPLQSTFVTLLVITKSPGSVIVILSVVEQPFASVTVTVKVPAVKLLAVAVVCAAGSDHK